ncbi:MAG: hypothetical protein ACTSRW_16320 [Candidatus Helarchaeota archaeon]
MTNKRKKFFTCKLCGQKYKMKQIGRVKISNRLKKGEETIIICSKCAKERIRIA